MKNGLNLDELYKIEAISIVECIKNDCEFYGIKVENNENVRFTRVIFYSNDSLLVDFDVWNGNEWKNAEIPYAFNKKENKDLFLNVVKEVKDISELKDFVEYN